MMENGITPELIKRARAAAGPKEIMSAAEQSGVAITEEQAIAYFEQLHARGELPDEELDNVAGGGCQTKVDGKKYTVVTSGVNCFTGCFEQNYNGYTMAWKREDHIGLRRPWDACSLSGQCGSCVHLGFKDGLGYCEKS